MDRRAPLRRKTELGPGDKSRERGSTFANQGAGLRRDTPKTRQAVRRAQRRAVSPASEAQRAKVRDAPCVRCGAPGPCHPAHLIDRSLGGDDDPRAVVPLCAACHRLYDEGGCSLLEHLEPHYRVELAYAVELVGLLAAVNRVTNDHYEPRRAA
jgi:hypothetical protein